ncbi:MAG: hypothetical protein PVG51_17585 [Desulfosarcina sp.]|jgi:hypothetical protein
MDQTDKRRSTRRNPIKAAFVCRPFTSSEPSRVADAVMHNYSNNGSYVKTSQAFNLGTILHLRLVSYLEKSTYMPTENQPRSICLAEVKWLQELADNETHRYGLGLKNLV